MKLTYLSFKRTIVFLFVFSLGVNGQEVDVNKLITEASAQRAARDELSDFTFRLSFSIKEIKKGRDKISSMVYDTFMPSKIPAKGMRFPLILIEKDGIPLDEGKLEAQRPRLIKYIEKLEREAAKNSPIVPPDAYPKADFGVDSVFGSDRAWEVDMMQVLRGNDFSNPRSVSLNNRETIFLDFQPRPGFAFTNKMRYFANLKGSIWIDTFDKKVVRLIGLSNVAENTAPTDAGKSIVVSYDLIRVAQNLWSLSYAELKTINFPNIFGKVGMDFKIQFTDFKRFRSEVDKSSVDAPPDKR